MGKTKKTFEEHSKIGKYSKKKGYIGEKNFSDKYQKIFGGEIRPMPRSGGFSRYAGDTFSGDIFFKGNVFADLKITIEHKYGYNAFSKDWLHQAWNDNQERGIIVWTRGRYSEKSTVVVLHKNLFDELIVDLTLYKGYETPIIPKDKAEEQGFVLWIFGGGYPKYMVMKEEFFIDLVKRYEKRKRSK